MARAAKNSIRGTVPPAAGFEAMARDRVQGELRRYKKRRREDHSTAAG